MEVQQRILASWMALLTVTVCVQGKKMDGVVRASAGIIELRFGENVLLTGAFYVTVGFCLGSK